MGTAIALKPYELKAGVPVLADGTTPALEDQIESKGLFRNRIWQEYDILMPYSDAYY